MDRRSFLKRASGSKSASALAPSYPPLQAPSVSTGLEPYTGPWGERQAAHLVRRTHFGLTRADLISALTQTPAQAVDGLLDAAIARPLPDTPSWYNQTDSGQNTEWVYEWQESWYNEMHLGGLRERMTLMWHDHFSTEVNVYYHAAFAYQYLTFLRENAFGDFRDTLRGIGLVPAMLIYLNGDLNTGSSPNENYAREVMELFSLGILGPDGTPNYTQEDITEVARALSGWVVDMGNLQSEFVPSRHDSGQKTIFGQTGNYDYNGFIDLLLQQRSPEIAHHIATKLYSWFVHPAPNADVVTGLTTTLQNNNFNVAVALRKLLKSAHFFDDAFISARIKCPSETLVGLFREMSLPNTDTTLSRFRELGFSLGMDILNPPNVAGWPGFSPDQYRAWITTGTVPERQGFADAAIFGDGVFDELDPLPLAEDLSDPTSAVAIVHDFAKHFLPTEMSQEMLDEMTEILLDGVPVWEWYNIYTQDPEAARNRLRGLLSFMTNLPEYQLT